VTTADKNTQQPIRDRLYTLALSLAEKLNHVANDEDILRQLANQLADEARAIGRDEADVYPLCRLIVWSIPPFRLCEATGRRAGQRRCRGRANRA
jgi:hypothetical protein